MTEAMWWECIFASTESQDDPVLREGFAIWLWDEKDDTGAGYLRWCLDTSGVKHWQNGPLVIRQPFADSRKAWWFVDREPGEYHPINGLPYDVGMHLSSYDKKDCWMCYYSSRREAEEDALRAWRKARS